MLGAVAAVLVCLMDPGADSHQVLSAAAPGSSSGVWRGYDAPRPDMEDHRPRDAAEYVPVDRCDHNETRTWTQGFDLGWDQAALEYARILSEAGQRLAASSDPEHLHTAALIEENPVRRMELMERAVSVNGDSAFRLWAATGLCAGLYEETGCPLQAWQQRLLALDGQNSEAWMLAAAIRLRAGAEGAALEAMRHAASSSESRVYWAETLEMTERALAAAGDLSFRDRVALGADFATIHLPDYSFHASLCAEQSAKGHEWAHACLRYGEVSETEGRTVLGQRAALVIQRVALKALGDQDKLEAAEARYESLQAVMNHAHVNGHRTMSVVTSSPTLFSRYLGLFRTRGEAATLAALEEEAEPSIRRNEFGDCVL